MKEIIERLKEMQDVGKLKAEFYGVLSQAIKALEAIEEAGEELPKAWIPCVEKGGISYAPRKAIDYEEEIKPLITKKNLRIKELEEKVKFFREKLAEKSRINKENAESAVRYEEWFNKADKMVNELQQENKKLKEEIEEIKNGWRTSAEEYQQEIKELKWIKDALAKRLKEVENE